MDLYALSELRVPQMTDGNVSTEHIGIANGIYLMLDSYSNPARSDKIEVYWDDKLVYFVLLDDPSDFPIVIKVTDDLNEGHHQAYYKITDFSCNHSTSPPTNVNIINDNPKVKYQPPKFIDAIDNVIVISSLDDNGRVRILVEPYLNIQVDDVVTLYITGKSIKNEPVFNEVLHHEVNFKEKSYGVTFYLSSGKLNELIEGTIEAYYEIKHFNSLRGLSDKSIVRVKLTRKDDDQELKIYSATNAVNYDYSSITVEPCNEGVISGQPGNHVVMSVTPDAEFVESNSSSLETTLDKNGLSRFKVRAKRQGAMVITAHAMLRPDITAAPYLIDSRPYFKASDQLPYISYSTGAPADGVSACSIYLMASKHIKTHDGGLITKVRISVGGTAKIVGYREQYADVNLNPDQSAEIHIVNSVSSIVNVVLTTPQATGTPVRIGLAFSKAKYMEV